MDSLRHEEDDRRAWDNFDISDVTDLLEDLIEYFAEPEEESGKLILIPVTYFNVLVSILSEIQSLRKEILDLFLSLLYIGHHYNW